MRKKDEFERNYLQTHNSPLNKSKIREFSPKISSIPQTTKIQKLLDVRKSLNSYLQTKHNNYKVNSIYEDQFPTMKSDKLKSEENYVAITETNSNMNPTITEGNTDNKQFKVIKYDDKNQNKYNLQNQNYFIENKKEKNP